MKNLLFAWTAAHAIVAALAGIVFLVGGRLLIVMFTAGQTRHWFDFLFALMAIVLVSLLLWYS
jgi:hypothetical protein